MDDAGGVVALIWLIVLSSGISCGCSLKLREDLRNGRPHL
jgi:hypothetical protein